MNRTTSLTLITLTALATSCAAPSSTSTETSRRMDTAPGTSPVTTIAACPTCVEYVRARGATALHVLPTASTSESAALLASGAVDLILAGRTLRPDEPQADTVVLRDGYSLLSSEERVLQEDALQHLTLYTDLDDAVLRSIPLDATVVRVEDVYAHIDRDVVLTTWENTDYARARVVHLLDAAGRRVPWSRRVALYCRTTCDTSAAQAVLAALRE